MDSERPGRSHALRSQARPGRSIRDADWLRGRKCARPVTYAVVDVTVFMENSKGTAGAAHPPQVTRCLPIAGAEIAQAMVDRRRNGTDKAEVAQSPEPPSACVSAAALSAAPFWSGSRSTNSTMAIGALSP